MIDKAPKDKSVKNAPKTKAKGKPDKKAAPKEKGKK